VSSQGISGMAATTAQAPDDRQSFRGSPLTGATAGSAAAASPSLANRLCRNLSKLRASQLSLPQERSGEEPE